MSGSWSHPAQITHGGSIPVSVGTALRTFYGIAASNGTAHVTYLRQHGTSASDVLVVTRPVGGSWSAPIQVSSQDSQNCSKFGLSIVATAGRLGLPYARGHTGYCGSSTGIFENTPFVFAGPPDHLTAVGSLEGTKPDCFSTSLETEGDLFRFVTSCDQTTSLGRGQLYYKAEYLDAVGPVAKLFAPARSKAPTIHLHWSAQDPQPGSGVAFYQLQVREDSGSWRTLLTSTHAKQVIYRRAQAGHRYTFRLRAQDRTANWGVWATGTTLSG